MTAAKRYRVNLVHAYLRIVLGIASMERNGFQIQTRLEIHGRDNVSKPLAYCPTTKGGQRPTYCNVGTIPCMLESICSVIGACTDGGIFTSSSFFSSVLWDFSPSAWLGSASALLFCEDASTDDLDCAWGSWSAPLFDMEPIDTQKN